MCRPALTRMRAAPSRKLPAPGRPRLTAAKVATPDVVGLASPPRTFPAAPIGMFRWRLGDRCAGRGLLRLTRARMGRRQGGATLWRSQILKSPRCLRSQSGSRPAAKGSVPRASRKRGDARKRPCGGEARKRHERHGDRRADSRLATWGVHEKRYIPLSLGRLRAVGATQRGCGARRRVPGGPARRWLCLREGPTTQRRPLPAHDKGSCFRRRATRCWCRRKLFARDAPTLLIVCCDLMQPIERDADASAVHPRQLPRL